MSLQIILILEYLIFESVDSNNNQLIIKLVLKLAIKFYLPFYKANSKILASLCGRVRYSSFVL